MAQEKQAEREKAEQLFRQEIGQLHIDIDKIRDELRCSEQEALLYYISYQLWCLHYHLDEFRAKFLLPHREG